MSKIIKENVINGEKQTITIQEFEKELKSYLNDSYIDYIKQGSRNTLSCSSYIEVAYEMDYNELNGGHSIEVNDYIYYKQDI